MNVQNVINLTESAPEGTLQERIEAVISSGRPAAQIARESGIADSAMSRWRKGKYEGDNPALEAKLSAWLDNLAAKEELQIPEPPAWVQTPTAQRILRTLQFAQMMHAIAPIYGASGVGKTFTARYYASHFPNVWVATMSPDTAKPSGALEEIAGAIGINAKGWPKTVRKAIEERIKGRAGLLILDDAQHLVHESLEIIRRISDTTDVGVALIGNETVYNNLTGVDKKADFARLYSRVGNRLYTKRVSNEDVAKVAAAWGITGQKEVNELIKIAAPEGEMRGGLRSMTYILQQAAMVASGDSALINATDIRDAAKHLGGSQ